MNRGSRASLLDVLVRALTAVALITMAPAAGIGLGRASAATIAAVAPSVPEDQSAGILRPILPDPPAVTPRLVVPVESLVSTVPNIVKQPGDKAVRALRTAGYRVYVGKARYDGRVRKGSVSAQILKAGARLRKGRTVTVYLSLGAKPKPAWKSAKASVYGGHAEAQHVAGPYGSTSSLEARHVLYFAHKSLPFGTKVMFNYRGRTVTAICVDRGPYVRGRAFDLGSNTAAALRFGGVDRLSWVVVK